MNKKNSEAERFIRFLTNSEPQPYIDYKSIFDSYKNTDRAGRERILSDADKKYGLAFDAEEILEMIMDELREQARSVGTFEHILNSSTLRWHEIASEIKRIGFDHYSELMVPAMDACGLDLGEFKDQD